ncbi:hypothetical protein ACFC0M_05880 [Streptomyces sp. NPDC056149]|uniref:hypothetical protein n=1 Tax=Streptomyces sp. NPDC056149 TaxID=3345728 RepID=UPI0035DB4ABB
MFHRIRQRRADAELQRQTYQAYLRIASQAPIKVVPTPKGALALGEPAAVVDDFLPPELRVPSHDQVEGRMMPWPWPVVLGDEVVTCAECGTYRDWLILSTRDQIWLRCRAGHQQHEARLDTAWYNRHAGPVDSTHATFEDCLRHLDH